MSNERENLVRALGKSGIVIFLGTFFELGVSFFAKFLVARTFGTVNYGEVAVGLTTLTLLAILVRLGLHTGVARIGPQYEGDERKSVYLSAFVIQSGASLFAGTALFLLRRDLATILGNPNLAPVFGIIAFGIPAVPLMRISLGIVQAEERSGPKVIVQNIVHPLSRIGLIAVAIALDADPSEIALAYVTASWIAALLALGFALRASNFVRFSERVAWKHRELLAFSLPLMLSTGMAFIVGQTDNLMIEYFLETSAVGSYDIAYTIGQTLTVGVGAFGYLFLPQVSKLYAEDKWEQIDHLYKLVTKWIVFITLPGFLVLALFPSVVLRYTFGPEYLAGAPVLALISTTYFARAVVGPNKGLLSAVGDTRYILYANVVGVIVNVLLNVVLIPNLGIRGAAVASLLSFTSIMVLYNVRLWREYDAVPVSRRTLAPAVGFSSVAVVGVLLARFTIAPADEGVVLGAAVLAGSVLYPICIVGLGGLESDDVMLVNSAEDRFGVDLEPVKRIARRLM